MWLAYDLIEPIGHVSDVQAAFLGAATVNAHPVKRSRYATTTDFLPAYWSQPRRRGFTNPQSIEDAHRLFQGLISRQQGVA